MIQTLQNIFKSGYLQILSFLTKKQSEIQPPDEKTFYKREIMVNGQNPELDILNVKIPKSWMSKSRMSKSLIAILQERPENLERI